MPEIESGLPAIEFDADRMAAITMEAAAASGRALRAGAMAPAFRLHDHDGHQISLQDLSDSGPVIVHFYRGSWCTYCSDSLTDLAAAHGDIRAAGGRVVAIAPPPSRELVEGAQAHAAHLPFASLVDDGMKVAVAYGVAYSLPAELRPIYIEARICSTPQHKSRGMACPNTSDLSGQLQRHDRSWCRGPRLPQPTSPGTTRYRAQRHATARTCVRLRSLRYRDPGPNTMIEPSPSVSRSRRRGPGRRRGIP